MKQTALVYQSSPSDRLVIQSDGRVYISSDLSDTQMAFRNMTECEKHFGAPLEELYPSQVIRRAKTSLGYSLYYSAPDFYECRGEGVYVRVGTTEIVALPKTAKKVDYSLFPIKD